MGKKYCQRTFTSKNIKYNDHFHVKEPLSNGMIVRVASLDHKRSPRRVWEEPKRSLRAGYEESKRSVNGA